jgi:uncharacterized protein (DUF2147 family)
MKSALARLTLSAVLTLAASSAQAQLAQLGFWITESGNLEVEIAPCGDALCGTVTRVLANRAMDGAGPPSDAADKRPALGMKILSALHATGDASLSGEIYNRENAKTYRVRLTMDGPQQMLVHAYVGLPLFGKTQLWRRVLKDERNKP